LVRWGISTGVIESIASDLPGIAGHFPIVRAWGAASACLVIGAFVWAFQDARADGVQGAELRKRAIKTGVRVLLIEIASFATIAAYATAIA